MAEKAKQGRLDAATMFPMMELFEDSAMTQRRFQKTYRCPQGS